MFRDIIGLVAWHWFWGMSVYVWTRYRINYIYLFEFDPRNVDTRGARRGRPSVRPFDLAVALTRCGALQWKFSTMPWTRHWCASSACSCTIRSVSVAPARSNAEVGPLSHKSQTPLSYPVLPPLCVLQAVNDKFLALIPPLWYPTFLILYTIKRLIFPLRTRLPLWTAIKHVAMAPFITPTFFVTCVGDVFTSMVKVFQDLLFAVCFLAYGDFLLSDDLLDTEPHGRLPQAWTHTFWYCSYVSKQVSTLICKNAPGHNFYYRSKSLVTL